MAASRESKPPQPLSLPWVDGGWWMVGDEGRVLNGEKWKMDGLIQSYLCRYKYKLLRRLYALPGGGLFDCKIASLTITRL